MASYNELVKKYRKLAKRADQRLVRLEALSYEKGYEYVRDWAYATAMRDIKIWAGPDAKRFNTKPPETAAKLERKIADIENFLSSKTSTKKGITEIYENRAKSINDRFGTDFNWRDFANAIESGVYEKLKSDYGYNTALTVVAKMQRDRKQLEAAVKEANEKNIKISKTDAMSKLDYDMIIKQTISKELEKQGVSILDLK